MKLIIVALSVAALLTTACEGAEPAAAPTVAPKAVPTATTEAATPTPSADAATEIVKDESEIINLEGEQYDMFQGQVGIATASSDEDVAIFYWDEWVGSDWSQFHSSTDNPSTVTVEEDDFENNPVGIRVRAKLRGADYALASYTILFQWRPLVIEYNISNPIPNPNESVTLTIGGAIPTDGLYQWQSRDAEDQPWVDVATGRSIVEKYAEGAKQYRVVMSHPEIPDMASETFSVSWGNPFVVTLSVLVALDDRVETNPEYIEADTELMECLYAEGIDPAQISTFSDMASWKYGLVRKLMDTVCKAQGDKMFAVHESVHIAEIAAIRESGEFAQELLNPIVIFTLDGIGDAEALRRDLETISDSP